MGCCDYLEPPFTALELRENSLRILNDDKLTYGLDRASNIISK